MLIGINDNGKVMKDADLDNVHLYFVKHFIIIHIIFIIQIYLLVLFKFTIFIFLLIQSNYHTDHLSTLFQFITYFFLLFFIYVNHEWPSSSCLIFMMSIMSTIERNMIKNETYLRAIFAKTMFRYILPAKYPFVSLFNENNNQNEQSIVFSPHSELS